MSKTTDTKVAPEIMATQELRLPRRFLPSMSLLCAFEAASRLKSFTAAAVELNLTQSAVSRQVRALEELLGSEVFHREKQTITLTPAGEAYAREVREALKRIAGATLAFRGNPRGGSLNIAILPMFGARWLAPRLPAFFAQHADITINLLTRLAPSDFDFDTADAAIHFGAPESLSAELQLLMPETLVPACSPALVSRFKFKTAADLLSAPLIHLVSRPDSWERWFSSNGVDADLVHGMLVDQYAIATEAAIAGLGVALLPKLLVRAELERRELVVAINRPLTSAGRYYLAWPANRADYAPLIAFRNWITEQANAEEHPP